jgi:hypothetical protein
MIFENAFTNEEKRELFVEIIQRSYFDDHWIPSDPGPGMGLSVGEVEQTLLNLNANKVLVQTKLHRRC